MRDFEMKSIAADAIKKKGATNQIMMLMEECGELITAANHLRRGKCRLEDFVTELADVSVMIDQMLILYNCEEAFNREKKRKYDRLRYQLMK